MSLPCEAKGSLTEWLCLESEIARRLSGATRSKLLLTKWNWKFSSFEIDREICWFAPLELNRPKNWLKQIRVIFLTPSFSTFRDNFLRKAKKERCKN